MARVHSFPHWRWPKTCAAYSNRCLIYPIQSCLYMHVLRREKGGGPRRQRRLAPDGECRGLASPPIREHLIQFVYIYIYILPSITIRWSCWFWACSSSAQDIQATRESSPPTSFLHPCDSSRLGSTKPCLLQQKPHPSAIEMTLLCLRHIVYIFGSGVVSRKMMEAFDRIEETGGSCWCRPTYTGSQDERCMPSQSASVGVPNELLVSARI